MKRYSEYKDSGVKWIGEIPRHWKRSRFKFEAKTNSGSTPKNIKGRSYDDSNITWIRTTDLTNSYVYSSSELLTYNEFKSASCPWLPKDTLLIAMYGGAGTIGKCGLMGVEGTINQALCSLEINSKHSEIYFLYLAQTMRPVWMEYANSSRKDPNISQEIIRNAYIPLPPLPEQEAIVTYLDTKVAKIDEYISIAEKKIAALEELKQTIIAEAVTRGIHKNVPMKESGVKWIGMIPEHWKVNKIRSHFKERRVKVSDKDFQALSVAKIGIVPQLEDACKTDNGDNRKQVLKGDFVVNSRSDRKGSCGISPLDGSVSLINIVLRPFNILQEYVHYLFRSHNYIEEFYRNGRGIVADLWTTRYSEMRNIQIPVPPLAEQQEIVTYIEAKVANINQLCQAERSQIEKLKEYKQRLISDVVTGKVKVTND